MAKHEPNAGDRPVYREWAKHIKPDGKRTASKRRRRNGYREIEQRIDGPRGRSHEQATEE